MEKTYLSPRDFERNCPCAFLLDGYVQSLIPINMPFCFNHGWKSDDQSYTAIYDILPSHDPYVLEVTCTISDSGEYQYSFKKRNG